MLKSPVYDIRDQSDPSVLVFVAAQLELYRAKTLLVFEMDEMGLDRDWVRTGFGWDDWTHLVSVY